MVAYAFNAASLAVATAPATPFASMLNVAASTSTKTGVAPTKATTSAVAQKVNDGHNTASPGPISIARSTSTRASVPLAQVTTCLAPQNAASSVSKAFTSGPSMYWQ